MVTCNQQEKAAYSPKVSLKKFIQITIILKVCWIKAFISGFEWNSHSMRAPTGRPHCLLQPYKCEYSTDKMMAIKVSAVQCSAVHYSAVHYSAVQCSAVQYSAVQCSSVQCNAVQCSAKQCTTMPYVHDQPLNNLPQVQKSPPWTKIYFRLVSISCFLTK